MTGSIYGPLNIRVLRECTDEEFEKYFRGRLIDVDQTLSREQVIARMERIKQIMLLPAPAALRECTDEEFEKHFRGQLIGVDPTLDREQAIAAIEEAENGPAIQDVNHELCGLPCEANDDICSRPCVRPDGHEGRHECKNHWG